MTKRKRNRLTPERTLFMLPSVPDAGPPDLKDALAIRNAASVSGQCRCGATGTLQGPDRYGVMHLVFMHEHDCPAGDDNIGGLSGPAC
jgi:hypothetical protein